MLPKEIALVMLMSLFIMAIGKDQLKFKSDGTFRIMQFTDTHFGEAENLTWGPQQDLNTSRIMKVMLAQGKPDLVVFTGDCITGNNIADNATAYWKLMLQPLIQNNIPWAITFGNHDDLASGQNGSRDDIMKFDTSLPGSYSKRGPKHVAGVSNYHLELFDSNGTELRSVLWMLDSNDECEGVPAADWGCIEESQVDWFRRSMSKFDTLVLGLAFFHIPLEEHLFMYNNSTSYGWLNDSGIACQSLNTGFFDAILETKQVQAVFVGHDHGSDFCGEWFGIQLCFGRHSGYGGYGDWTRGSRVIDLKYDENSRQTNFNTWIMLEDGTTQENTPAHPAQPPYLQSCFS